MKRITLLVAIMATTLLQSLSAQDKTTTGSNTLSGYYAVKDALVSGNANLANSKAVEFVETLTTDSTLPEANRIALIKEASNIANTKDIKKQRTYFSALSESIFAVAKAQKLSSQPIYKAYCPMVKASWLSSSSSIKNPYYGSAMLTCGKVVETLK